jgi:hypothetical protein
MTQVVVGDFRDEKPKFLEYHNDGRLLDIFDQIIVKFPSSNIKIILGSSVSYTVSWPISGEVPTRDSVKVDLQKYIPEDFSDNQFDWKIDKQNQVEAIVATGDLYKTLTELSAKYPRIRFETQSSQSLLLEMGESNLAKETGGEIFVYAASKGAVRGSDQKVLDLDISGKSTTSTSTFSNYSLYIVLTIIASTILAIYALITFIKQPVARTSQVLSTPTPTATPFVARPKDISLYSVTVQNGTNIDGLATITKETLTSLGFSNITSTNASTPSATTKVILKEAISEDLQQKIITALGSRVPDISFNSVDNNERIDDIVILLGEK